MTAPRMPPQRPSIVPVATAIPLTEAEQEVLASFRAADAIGRGHIDMLAKGVARRHPHHPLPALRLIVGGAK